MLFDVQHGESWYLLRTANSNVRCLAKHTLAASQQSVLVRLVVIHVEIYTSSVYFVVFRQQQMVLLNITAQLFPVAPLISVCATELYRQTIRLWCLIYILFGFIEGISRLTVQPLR